MLAIKKRVTQLGFTLIELMVVVAIMGLLLAAGLASYTTVQKTARDGRRLQDVKAIQDALEQSKGSNGIYPIPATQGVVPPALASFFSGGAVPAFPTGGTMFGTTAGPSSYEYTTDAAGATYCVCTGVEAGVRANANANSAGVCTFAAPAAGTNRFCLTAQQ